MQRIFLLLLLLPQAAFSADLAITSAVYSNNSFALRWPSTIPVDPALRRVMDIERRQSLAVGAWEDLAVRNISGAFIDTAPPAPSGFYRLKEADYPLALVGPDASSDSQGVRLLSPGQSDVLFLKPFQSPAASDAEQTNTLTVLVNGAYRASVFFSSDRLGMDFLYALSDSSLQEPLMFGQGEARLTTPEFLSAQSAAEAGAAAAQALVADLLRRYPDSATVWQDVGSGPITFESTNEATVLYVRAKSDNTNQGATPGEFGSDITLMAQPLASGGRLVPLSEIGTAMPFNAVSNSIRGEMVNLNATNSFQPNPWIGARSSPTPGAPTTAAKWIYVSRDGGPTNASNPPIARYAYWVEDESFKVNLNTATNGLRGTNAGTSPQEVTIDGMLAASANLRFYTSRTSDLIRRRTELGTEGFSSVAEAAETLQIIDPRDEAEFRFLSTVRSAGLDLSRGGFKRFNINSATNGVSGPTDATNIRASLDRIIATITNSNSVPDFGQRFYRLATDSAGINATDAVSTNHAAIYLNKIAANILDYIDADDQPTIVNNDATFGLRTGRPTFGIEPLGGGTSGANSVAAMGIENVPRLQEYAIHGRIRRMDPIGYNTGAPPTDPSAVYEISIDHYFEFWNPGTRDIVLNGMFLKIYDQPSFGTFITGPLSESARQTSEIPLDGVVFPAGQVTVLTTAPQEEINSLLVGANFSRVVSLPTPDEDRIFSGITRDVRSSSFSGFNRLFTVRMNPRTTSASDFYSAVLLANHDGIIESFVGLPIGIAGTSSAMELTVTNSSIQASIGIVALGNRYFTRGGSLRGNSSLFQSPTSTEGDPRALNEQLELRIYSPSSDADQTRFFLSGLGDNNVPSNSTLGAPNGNFVRSSNWVDFSSLAAGAGNAPLVVRNNAFQSIGELGHITDPARVPGTSGAMTNVVYSRGGGRTLRVGQSEHPRWHDGNQTNASRTWTSWRLTDIFTTKTNVSVAGLVNPNGALRDGGVALRAALHGMVYLPSPEGAPGLEGRTLNAFYLNVIAATKIAHLTNAAAAGLPSGSLNAFWERGEISELPIFNSGIIPAAMSNKFDRGREELVRRSIEMLTTRGSVFTVYVIGQALQVTAQATNVISSARLKRTFEVLPQFSSVDSFDDNFNPAQAVRVARRFSTPTNFPVSVVASEIEEAPDQ